ncbi:MurR/RpiR family transcriptional regulator [Nonomuraea sp. MG754425]|uniref:MurR/RpiR family transcriptional regulator n=1 Tax=Nonomuraea sp. MG754425 TaxID=2570319 RepID=UPI001F1A408C|nr:MurR/RpiR family transcriptional regulator [Nonomuraea sp. MG754425]MCF6476610.1 MurR/RpiR family transcriptional regulator [Nonomuraea sp. MG754425]
MRSAEPHDGSVRSERLPLPPAVRALEDALPALTGKKRQAAEYFLAHPEQVAFGSLRKTALAARVSTGIVAKLLYTLGYRSYEVFKGDFQEWVTGTRDYFGIAQAEPQDRAAGRTLLQSIADHDMANIGRTNTPGNRAAIRTAARQVEAARRVYVMGMRGASCVSVYLAYQLEFVRPDVILLDDAHGTLVDRLSDFDPSDLLIVISYYPYTPITVKTARYAAELGMDVVALTDRAESPVAVAAQNLTLTFSVSSPWIYNSITSSLVLAQALVAETLAALGESAMNWVNERDRLLSRFSTFDR